jgi:CYTH domain-containing protein
MTDRPKYALPEIERRWLVERADLPDLGSLPKMTIKDKYLSSIRLRLRLMHEENGSQYKLGKKYGDMRGYSESITNIYLSRGEYELLNKAAGLEVTKSRYHFAGGSLDIYPDTDRIILFSVEFSSEAFAASYQPPDFVGEEVTHDPRFSGLALASGQRSPLKAAGKPGLFTNDANIAPHEAPLGQDAE